MLVIAAELVAALTADELIATQRDAFRATVDGTGRFLGFARGEDPTSDAFSFALTGMVDGRTGPVGKIGVHFPHNVDRGHPGIQALTVLLDPETGVPLACMDAAALTAARTSAAMAVAADVLSVARASRLGVLGTGSQAVATVRMISSVRRLESVMVWGRTPDRRMRVAASLTEELHIPVHATSDAREAVKEQDIIATCTLSREPVVLGSWLVPGQAVLTMGSHAEERREIDVQVSARGRTFVDTWDKCRVQCGPIVEALARGVLSEQDVVELGRVVSGWQRGRTSDDDILVFHSLGFGYQDATAAWAVYRRALELGLGREVAL